jgi:hypothetical protein
VHNQSIEAKALSTNRHEGHNTENHIVLTRHSSRSPRNLSTHSSMALQLSRVSLSEVHGLCTRALAASGLYAESVEAIARTISSAERDGCQSHGLFRLPGYCNALRAGKCSSTARPEVHDAAQAIVRVDACNGPAPYALEVGVVALAERTRSCGVGVLAVTNAYHFRCAPFRWGSSPMPCLGPIAEC